MGVAVPVDPQHLGDDPGVVALRECDHPGHQQIGVDLGAEFGHVAPVAEKGRSRGEDVSAGKRGAGGEQSMVRIRDLHSSPGTTGHRNGGSEQPVVGPDEYPFAVGDFHRDRAPRRADARVDDGEYHTRRDVADAAGERERPGAHIERCDAMSEIDHAYVWREVTDHGVDNADEFIGGAEIGQERNRLVATTHGRRTYLHRASVRHRTLYATRAGANPPMAPALVGATHRFRRARLHVDTIGDG